ncbi:MAG TPA: hypothetical protein VF290_19665 [Pyrinomonadaceae bacterium]
MSGDLHQDLGRGALTIQISGSLLGDEARDKFLKDVREKFLAGDPVDFVADITKESELEQVLIVSLSLDEQADNANAFRYQIALREYTEPPEPAGLQSDFGLDVDADLDLDVDLGLDLLDLPGLLGAVPEVGELLTPIEPAARQLKDAMSKAKDVLKPLSDLLG